MLGGVGMCQRNHAVSHAGHVVELYVAFLSLILSKIAMLDNLLGSSLDVRYKLLTMVMERSAHRQTVFKWKRGNHAR